MSVRSAILLLFYCGSILVRPYVHQGEGVLELWNPALGFALAFLLTARVEQWPVLLIAGLFFGIFTSAHHAVQTLLEICACGSLAGLLMRKEWFDLTFNHFNDIMRFIAAIGVACAGLVGFSEMVSLVTHPQAPSQSFETLIGLWVGDVIGATTISIFVMQHRMLFNDYGAFKSFFKWERLGEIVAIFIAVSVLFPAAHGSRFYPMFIPVVWIAARHGLKGIVVALVVINVTTAGFVTMTDVGASHILKLQILLLSLTVTGLLLGGVVSERERVQLAVVRGEARLRGILDMAPEGIVISDENNVIEATNRYFESLVGEHTSVLVGAPLAKVLKDNEDPASDTKVVIASDGTKRIVETSTATINMSDRDVHVTTVRDVTARKHAEMTLGLRRAEMEQVSRNTLTIELAAILAHELNQPLAAIVAYLAACQRGIEEIPNFPQRTLTQLNKAALQAERAGNIIRRLRTSLNTSSLVTSTIAVADMFAEVRSLLDNQLEVHGVTLEMSVFKGLIAKVDRLQIEQVLINLIRNSLEALVESHEADKCIIVSAHMKSDGMIEVTIMDRGPGIAEEISANLFSPFVTTKSEGMGLGLIICRSIVQAHGGRLWQNTQMIEGAALHFTIPSEHYGKSNDLS